MELKQELGLKHKLSREILQSAAVLQMGTRELKEYLQECMLENPVIELEESYQQTKRKEVERKLEWLESGDYQNKIYYRQECEAAQEIAMQKEQSLSEYLLEQLIYVQLDKKSLTILRYIIQSLDERGYFTEDIFETARILGVTKEDVLSAKEILYSMEPVGAGAADLKECLLLQLQKKKDTDLAREIVENDLEEFGKNQLTRIMKKTGKSLTEVKVACETIRGLNPRPSNSFSSRPFKEYLIPDVVVVKLKDHFEILVNDYEIPQIIISSDYKAMLKENANKEAAAYIMKKIHQAGWLQQCVSQRNQTLLKLAVEILQEQMKFFQFGRGNLIPITQKELAQKMGVHPSTISRAVKGKYLQCSWGVYPLSYFFSTEIAALKGEEEKKGKTSEQIKALMQQIIEDEDKCSPFSDKNIMEKLLEMGVSISRRTVAKYRDSMGIADALGRKQF